MHGWRWIMIIEGIPTVILGVIAFFAFANEPTTAYYLTEEERVVAQARLDRQPGHTESAKQFHWNDVLQAFYDWKIWMFCFAQFGTDVMLYGGFSLSLSPYPRPSKGRETRSYH